MALGSEKFSLSYHKLCGVQTKSSIMIFSKNMFSTKNVSKLWGVSPNEDLSKDLNNFIMNLFKALSEQSTRIIWSELTFG